MGCTVAWAHTLAAPRAEAPGPIPQTSGTPHYSTRIVAANSIGTTVTNFGGLGNNFISRSPSLEYPVGAGFEHLSHGGLWVGAQAQDQAGAFTGVTTGAFDLTAGLSPSANTEFTPGSGTFLVRSSNPASAYYSPDAVSEEDVICVYDDLSPAIASGGSELHRSLAIQVRQTTHAWSVAGFEDIFYYRFAVKNLGQPLQSVWIGLWTELSSGNKNAYACWPPSAACGPGSWYSKKWLQWDGDLRMIREHYCQAQPVPAGCNLAAVPPWIGVKLLTPPGAGQSVTLAAWRWSVGNTLRDQDVERYALMSAGTIQNLSASDLQPGTGDPVELLALGPFPIIAPGDSVEVEFALIGGSDVADIQTHAVYAQGLRDHAYQFPLSVVAPAGRLALLAPFPNPTQHGDPTLSFVLEGTGDARLDLFDAAGRHVGTRDLTGYGPGAHVLRWAGLAPLRTGMYMVRLEEGGRAVSRPLVILR